MSVKLPEFIKFRGATYKRASEYEGENLVHEAWGSIDTHGSGYSEYGGGYRGYVVSYDPSLGDPVEQGIQGNKSRREDEYLGEFPSRKYALIAANQWEEEQWGRENAAEEAWYDEQEEEWEAQEHRDMERSYRPKTRERGRNRYVPSNTHAATLVSDHEKGSDMSAKTPEYIKFRGATYKRASHEATYKRHYPIEHSSYAKLHGPYGPSEIKSTYLEVAEGVFDLDSVEYFIDNKPWNPDKRYVADLWHRMPQEKWIRSSDPKWVDLDTREYEQLEKEGYDEYGR